MVAKRFRQDVSSNGGAGAPSPQAAVHRRARRFADASRATSGGHRFSQMGGTSAYAPRAGEVPATGTPEGAVAFPTDEAPRPVSSDPSVTGSFRTIGRGQGAVLPTRETSARAVSAARDAVPDARTLRASAGRRRAAARRIAERREGARASERSPRFLPVAGGIVAAAVVVGILLFNLLSAAFLADPSDGAGEGSSAVTQAVAEPGQGVTVGDFTYDVAQGAEGWEFTRSTGGETTVVAQLAGTPVSVLQQGGMLYVPESLPDGTWDVICYLMADGSVASQLLGSDGQPVTGQGTLASASLEGSSLVLVDDSGSSTTVPLS